MRLSVENCNFQLFCLDKKGKKIIISGLPGRRFLIEGRYILKLHSPVAQLVEQVAVNHRVASSSLAGGAKFKAPNFCRFYLTASPAS